MQELWHAHLGGGRDSFELSQFGLKFLDCHRQVLRRNWLAARVVEFSVSSIAGASICPSASLTMRNHALAPRETTGDPRYLTIIFGPSLVFLEKVV